MRDDSGWCRRPSVLTTEATLSNTVTDNRKRKRQRREKTTGNTKKGEGKKLPL